jgi:hypothetical protein
LGAFSQHPDTDALTTFSAPERAALAQLGLHATGDFARAVLVLRDQAAELCHFMNITAQRLTQLYRQCCLLNDFALHWEGVSNIPPAPPVPPAPFEEEYLPVAGAILGHLPELRSDLQGKLWSALRATEAADPSSLISCFPNSGV